MKQNFFNAKKAYRELRERYNIKFADILIQNGFKVYLFGGSLRDMVRGKEWKDADIRAWIPISAEERDKRTEQILRTAKIKIKSKIIFNDKFTIYRFMPKGSTASGVIDFTVVTKQFEVIPDFTVNGLYFDLDTKELIDPHNALRDIKKKIIRAVLDPSKQFRLEPHMIFRAVKGACQFGFAIEKSTLEAMKKLSNLTVETLEVVADNKIEGMTEWFIGNIFRGLKYDPVLFVQLWNNTGLTKVFFNFIGKRLNLRPNSYVILESVFNKKRKYKYEEALNIFISSIAKELDPKNPKSKFKEIITLFSITAVSEYGDFVIDSSKIKYLS